MPNADVLFDGFLGALLGSLISVVVAFGIVRATKKADYDFAREQAALAAAESVQERTLSLINLTRWVPQGDEPPDLAGEIQDWEDLLTLKESALSRTPIANLTTEAVEVVNEWLNKNRDYLQAVEEAYLQLRRSPRTMDRLKSSVIIGEWQPVAMWLRAYVSHIRAFRSGNYNHAAVMPARPSYDFGRDVPEPE